ncbi:MAG: alpha/beta fold hydrolase [Acidimicrobiales bacterium]
MSAAASETVIVSVVKVVIIDARGHGQSDKPHDPDSYALPTLTSDVVAMLDTLGVDRAHFFGLPWEADTRWAWPRTRPVGCAR